MDGGDDVHTDLSYFTVARNISWQISLMPKISVTDSLGGVSVYGAAVLHVDWLSSVDRAPTMFDEYILCKPQ